WHAPVSASIAAAAAPARHRRVRLRAVSLMTGHTHARPQMVEKRPDCAPSTTRTTFDWTRAPSCRGPVDAGRRPMLGCPPHELTEGRMANGTLVVRDLSVSYGRAVRALRGVSLD